MPDNEAGAFLNITPDVLKKLDSFDEKLEKIEKHAHTAADALKNGFGSVVVDTRKLESAIASLASKIGALNTTSNSVGNIGTAAQGSARGVSSMNESLTRAAWLLNQIGNIRIGQNSFSGWNIAELKEGISDIKKFVENTKTLSKAQQQQAVEAMRYMKMELDYQRQTDEQRAQSAEKAAQRKEAADRRAYKAGADLAKAQNYKQNTTAQGALDFSKTANTLQRQITAIEYLKKARLSLNTTDANYKSTLEQINQAIARHNQALTEAGVKSQQLATRHRNLMDTAGQLSRQLALLFSVSQIEGYISKLANVRGEFELQQRSLEAILQNKAQAGQIFNKTVQLAVKSPFQIKELVTFTKQLAAYRIESDKLYDTTKRLADVSAGLGVDMGRLILAYGQVKAAAYLRGTEVRQFTEAGINLYGELQRYFEEVKGEAYTTAQIVDMISKRKVTFEDIENIFKRLTDSGGLFYNMQEIQAETLRGKISNLKDSIDVMLNSIGKANEDTLKGSIDSIKVLIDNWETVVEVAKTFGVVIGSLAIASKFKLASKGAMTLSTLLNKGVDSAFAFGKALKASLPLMALGLSIQYVTNLVSRLNEYNKTISNIGNKKYEAKLKIAEFDNEAKTDARKALNALVKEMNNAGFSIKIKTDLSEEEAKKQFDDYKRQYEEFIEDIASIEAKYAALKKGEGFIGEAFGGNIDESLSSYSEKAGELMIVGNQARKELLRIATESKTLTEQQKQELKELAINAKDSAEGYAEVANKLREVTKVDIHTFTTSFGATMSNVTTSFGGLQSKVLEGFLNTSKGFDEATENAKEKIIALFGEVNKEISSDEKNKLKLNIDTLFLNKQIDEVTKNLAYKIYNIPIVSTIEKESGEETNIDTKHQRDILSERISLIKELNKEYEKLNKVMGSDKAAKTVMERYADSLKNVNMPKNIIGDAFLPNKQNTAKALQEISKIITDFRKKQGAINDSYQLLDSDDVENIKKQLDKTKKNIEAMFNGLDLHKKLKDAGLSEAEVQQLFPGLAKTLDDVQKGIEAEYQKKFPKGEYLIADTDANKQYLADLNKLNQQRIKDSQDLVIELTKNYKSQLTDRLQLDRWYYEERAKIQRAKLTDEQKTLYESNLTSQYNKKSDENTWKQFQNSDMYISMFENIEGASTRMLTAMRDKLMSLRENLKDLPADQLKAIINQQEKIDEMIAKKNPFIGLTSGVKEYIQFLKERKELEEENIRANNAVDYYTSQSNEQSKIVEQKRQEYNAAVATSGILSKEARQLSVQLETEKSKLDIILKQLTAEKKISKETAEQIRNGQNLGDTLKNKIGESGRIFSEFSSALPQIASDLENVFGTMSDGTKDTINRTAEAAGGIAQIATGIAQGPVGYLQAAMGLAKTVSALFGSDDARLQRQIEEHEKKIKKLEREYDKLKESIDNIWDITKLQEYGNELDENINKQIVSLNAMIAAERDKKDTDWDKINEWQEQIEDLRDTLADSANDMIAELGGVGSDENFKTLAENFASAWLEAFQETGDGLSGLQESFDDFMENYVKQQILLRLSDKFLKPMFEEFDSLIATRTDMEQEDQERYFELQAQITKLRNTANNSVVKSVAKKANAAADEIENSEEYKRLQKAYTDFLKPNDINTEAIKYWSDKMKEVFGEYNEAAEEIFNQIGWEPGGKANLSALTQGITQISEETANELSAILNSVRFFVANQTSDITAIRNILETEFLSSGDGSSNPMLIELKSQTEYLKLTSDNFESILSYSGNSKGRGIRVFIQ